MRHTTRTTDPDDAGRFVEITTGDAPSSVEVSFNAKGVAQLSVKCYYPDAATMASVGMLDIEEAILNVAAILYRHGVEVAGLADPHRLLGDEGEEAPE